MSGVLARLANAMGLYSPPESLAWDLFLGPAPPEDYHPVYHPFNWRGWVNWGVGAIGDMGAHLIDHAYWALDLEHPTTIETVSTPFNKSCFPMATTTYYEFPARGPKPPVRMTWYDGGLLPPKPPEIGEAALNAEGGALLIGTKGKLIYDTYGLKPRLLPASLEQSVGTPPQTLPRIATSHETNWSDAAKGKCDPSTPFEYAARLTEACCWRRRVTRREEDPLRRGQHEDHDRALEANDFFGGTTGTRGGRLQRKQPESDKSLPLRL
jgi:hypothetical protein